MNIYTPLSSVEDIIIHTEDGKYSLKEMLEKQIPVKVKSKVKHGGQGNNSVDHYCPRCMKMLFRKDDHFCGKCGQAVTWDG